MKRGEADEPAVWMRKRSERARHEGVVPAEAEEAHEEVVVLVAAERLVEPSRLLEGGAPHHARRGEHHQVAGHALVDRPLGVRHALRAQEGAGHQVAVEVHLVEVAVDPAHGGVGDERRHQLLEVARMPMVVLIEEGQVLARSASRAAALRAADCPAFACRSTRRGKGAGAARQLLQRAVGRAVVDHDQLAGRERLRDARCAPRRAGSGGR